ncbi:hypothetical protein OESDEN_05673 [Oesophagostomum dentatum]|uniref:Uncharacterized protein n=1 Tax=Oesophagostomum dentatum TaxID=61180 RepID=A0A0B1TAV3_OESDE|nr:hypothetical protein OESDEN_05673 [Oesophagostomum dentatum]
MHVEVVPLCRQLLALQISCQFFASTCTVIERGSTWTMTPLNQFSRTDFNRTVVMLRPGDVNAFSSYSVMKVDAILCAVSQGYCGANVPLYLYYSQSNQDYFVGLESDTYSDYSVLYSGRPLCYVWESSSFSTTTTTAATYAVNATAITTTTVSAYNATTTSTYSTSANETTSVNSTTMASNLTTTTASASTNITTTTVTGENLSTTTSPGSSNTSTTTTQGISTTTATTTGSTVVTTTSEPVPTNASTVHDTTSAPGRENSPRLTKI